MGNFKTGESSDLYDPATGAWMGVTDRNGKEQPVFSADGSSLFNPITGESISVGGTPLAITVSRSLTNADNGCVLVSTSGSAIVLTVPTGLRSGFNCTAFQGSTGAVSFAAGAGATVANASATFGLNTAIGLMNTGTDIYDVLTSVGQSAITSTVAAGAAVALTNATTANVTSINLPPGKYNVSAMVDYTLTGATSTLFQSGPNVVSATLPTQAGGSGLGTDGLASIPLILTTNTGVFQQSVAGVEVIVAVDTTLYLTACATFSAGTVTAYGTINARRA